MLSEMTPCLFRAEIKILTYSGFYFKRILLLDVTIGQQVT